MSQLHFTIAKIKCTVYHFFMIGFKGNESKKIFLFTIFWQFVTTHNIIASFHLYASYRTYHNANLNLLYKQVICNSFEVSTEWSVQYYSLYFDVPWMHDTLHIIISLIYVKVVLPCECMFLLNWHDVLWIMFWV